jgi:hypothetical protein
MLIAAPGIFFFSGECGLQSGRGGAEPIFQSALALLVA